MHKSLLIGFIDNQYSLGNLGDFREVLHTRSISTHTRWWA